MRLKFLGFNYWSMAVYRDDKTRKLWCDISNLGEHAPAGYKGVSAKGSVRIGAPNIAFVDLHTLSSNEIDGEPECPIRDGISVEFTD